MTSKNQLFEKNRDNLLCSELKHLYVAITRARKNLYIFEQNTDKLYPMLRYWTKKVDPASDPTTEEAPESKEKQEGREFNELVRIADIKQFTKSKGIVESTSPEQWKEQGIVMLKNKFYIQAIQCFTYANHPRLLKKTQALQYTNEGGLLLKKHQLATTSLTNQSTKGAPIKAKESEETVEGYKTEAIRLYLKAAELFLEIQSIKSAAKCYGTAGEYEKAGELYQSIGLYKEASQAYEYSRNYYKAGISKRLGGNYLESLVDFSKSNEWMEYLNTLELLSPKNNPNAAEASLLKQFSVEHVSLEGRNEEKKEAFYFNENQYNVELIKAIKNAIRYESGQLFFNKRSKLDEIAKLGGEIDIGKEEIHLYIEFLKKIGELFAYYSKEYQILFQRFIAIQTERLNRLKEEKQAGVDESMKEEKEIAKKITQKMEEMELKEFQMILLEYLYKMNKYLHQQGFYTKHSSLSTELYSIEEEKVVFSCMYYQYVSKYNYIIKYQLMKNKILRKLSSLTIVPNKISSDSYSTAAEMHNRKNQKIVALLLANLESVKGKIKNEFKQLMDRLYLLNEFDKIILFSTFQFYFHSDYVTSFLFSENTDRKELQEDRRNLFLCKNDIVLQQLSGNKNKIKIFNKLVSFYHSKQEQSEFNDDENVNYLIEKLTLIYKQQVYLLFKKSYFPLPDLVSLSVIEKYNFPNHLEIIKTVLGEINDELNNATKRKTEQQSKKIEKLRSKFYCLYFYIIQQIKFYSSVSVDRASGPRAPPKDSSIHYEINIPVLFQDHIKQLIQVHGNPLSNVSPPSSPSSPSTSSLPDHLTFVLYYYILQNHSNSTNLPSQKPKRGKKNQKNLPQPASSDINFSKMDYFNYFVEMMKLSLNLLDFNLPDVSKAGNEGESARIQALHNRNKLVQLFKLFQLDLFSTNIATGGEGIRFICIPKSHYLIEILQLYTTLPKTSNIHTSKSHLNYLEGEPLFYLIEKYDIGEKYRIPVDYLALVLESVLLSFVSSLFVIKLKNFLLDNSNSSSPATEYNLSESKFNNLIKLAGKLFDKILHLEYKFSQFKKNFELNNKVTAAACQSSAPGSSAAQDAFKFIDNSPTNKNSLTFTHISIVSFDTMKKRILNAFNILTRHKTISFTSPLLPESEDKRALVRKSDYAFVYDILAFQCYSYLLHFSKYYDLQKRRHEMEVVRQRTVNANAKVNISMLNKSFVSNISNIANLKFSKLLEFVKKFDLFVSTEEFLIFYQNKYLIKNTQYLEEKVKERIALNPVLPLLSECFKLKAKFYEIYYHLDGFDYFQAVDIFNHQLIPLYRKYSQPIDTNLISRLSTALLVILSEYDNFQIALPNQWIDSMPKNREVALAKYLDDSKVKRGDIMEKIFSLFTNLVHFCQEFPQFVDAYAYVYYLIILSVNSEIPSIEYDEELLNQISEFDFTSFHHEFYDRFSDLPLLTGESYPNDLSRFVDDMAEVGYHFDLIQPELTTPGSDSVVLPPSFPHSSVPHVFLRCQRFFAAKKIFYILNIARLRKQNRKSFVPFFELQANAASYELVHCHTSSVTTRKLIASLLNMMELYSSVIVKLLHINHFYPSHTGEYENNHSSAENPDDESFNFPQFLSENQNPLRNEVFFILAYVPFLKRAFSIQFDLIRSPSLLFAEFQTTNETLLSEVEHINKQFIELENYLISLFSARNAESEISNEPQRGSKEWRERQTALIKKKLQGKKKLNRLIKRKEARK